MASILNTVLPIFAILFAGYLAGRFRVLPDGSSEVLSRFVYAVALPALIFISLSRVAVGAIFDLPFIATLGGGMLATFCLSVAVARFAFPDRLAAQGLHGLSAMFSSTAYIGIPLLLVAFGEAALVPAIIGAVITGAVFLPIGIVMAELDRPRGSGHALLRPLIGVAGSPLLLATVAGLSASALGLGVWQPVATFCDLLGAAFVPCALFAAGLFMVGRSFRTDAREVAWLVFVKLAVHPLITWWLAYHLLEIETLWHNNALQRER